MGTTAEAIKSARALDSALDIVSHLEADPAIASNLTPDERSEFAASLSALYRLKTKLSERAHAPMRD